ncbi:EAL domain-containing protein [Aeromonas caviae]|uniref:EAL domain-containing protein n=1 Tax=Aeromonas caviae TaxID=648 RepID=UPI003754D07B
MNLIITAIGASAGGLEAISALLTLLTRNDDMCFVVLQHLSPSHRSMMAEILQRSTALSVKEMEDQDEPLPNMVFVVPAHKNAGFENGRFTLSAISQPNNPKPSINYFFTALAEEKRDRAIGIILSGTGSDGSLGCRQIHNMGGITIAQNPDGAKYDGMPRSAIESGVISHIMSIAEIAQYLSSIEVANNAVDALLHDDLRVQQIIELLNERLQRDFTGYKSATLIRRIQRRISAVQSVGLNEYLAFLTSSDSEAELLANDLLISVTAFFRDKEAYKALEATLRQSNTAAEDEFRIWVAGCATGEEAYSLAIMMYEIWLDRDKKPTLQIFATDIDDAALETARRGLYPAIALKELSQELVERYFNKRGAYYEIIKPLRDAIVFAKHNLVNDPPFLRLDVVSCRNVLIYFDTALQAKVLQNFHFGLKKNSLLFLGRSETVAQADKLFNSHDARERIFSKTREIQVLPLTKVVSGTIKVKNQKKSDQQDALFNFLINNYKLTLAVCDREGNVLHTRGHVEQFFLFPSGVTKYNLSDVLHPSVRADAISLFHKVQRNRSKCESQKRHINHQHIKFIVSILEQENFESYLLVFQIENEESKSVSLISSDTPSFNNDDLKNELISTREHLQALVEELATANEEMQALNEEAQASNEELQATNEELEACNEEMQATNEELISVNEELNVKTGELAKLYEEYSHLYDALEFPILVFDKELRLIRFNAGAAQYFSLRLTAHYQSVEKINFPDEFNELATLLGKTLSHGDRQSALIQHLNRYFHLIITPGLNQKSEVISLVVTMIDVSDLINAKNKLSASEHRLTALMEHTSIIFSMRDLHGRYLYVNKRFTECFDVDEADCIDKTDFSIFPTAFAGALWGASIESLQTENPIVREYYFNNKNQNKFFSIKHQTLRDSDNHPIALIIEGEDITERRIQESQLRINARIFEQAGEAIVVMDKCGIITSVNSAFYKITQFDECDVIGQPAREIIFNSTGTSDIYDEISYSIKTDGSWKGEILSKRKGGEVYPELLTINRVEDFQGNPEHLVAVFSDISQIKNSQKDIAYLAEHDSLTNLPNRATFANKLRKQLAESLDHNRTNALLFIDLDNFKNINDTLGHDVGDRVLQIAASRLRHIINSNDFIARLGGDEFTIILSDTTTEDAAAVAKKVIDEMSLVYEVANRQLFISASIGVAISPMDGHDEHSLLKAADAAMYKAKENGRNRFAFFEPELQVKLLRQATLERAMRIAIENNLFYLLYQPKFLINDKLDIVGAEALIRWDDPEVGSVSPADFIPLSEKNGLIHEITRIVIHTIIQQLVQWRKEGLKLLPIAFNCSARSLHEPDLADFVLSLMRENSLPFELLQIEITETVLLDNSQVVLSNLERLNYHGIKINLDDFGTGYSSLSYLKRLNISTLKIDQSFVSGLGNDLEDEVITEAVLSMAKSFSLETVAEGVETETQLCWLRQHGCHVAQGYYLAKPLTTNAFKEYLTLE